MVIKSVLCVASLLLIFAACTAVHAAQYICDRNSFIDRHNTLLGCQRRAAEDHHGENSGCCANNANGFEVIWSREVDGPIPEDIDLDVDVDLCPFCFSRVWHPQQIFNF